MLKMPSDDAKKEMMACARSKKNPDNSFFIMKENGEIRTRAYRDDRSYFPSIPAGTYEIHIQKEPFLSYSMLDDIIEAQMWGAREEERIAEEVEEVA
jgi:hypothetical protein